MLLSSILNFLYPSDEAGCSDETLSYAMAKWVSQVL